MTMAESGRRIDEGACGPLSFAWVVDQGTVREANEDSVAVHIVPWWDGTEAVVAAVADGLGGDGHGGAASVVAAAGIRELAETWADRGAPADWDAAHRALVAAFGAIDDRIRAEAQAAGHRPGATTLVAAVLAPDGFIHAYTGDSRLYHLQAGGGFYRTRDQSLAQIYLETGRIKSEAEATQRQRNTLFSTLGGEDGQITVEPEWETVEDDDGKVSAPIGEQPAFRRLASGDTVLLCSDGLWGVVALDEPDDGVSEDATAARDRWLQAAIDGGGPDNIGIVVVRVGDGGE
ncbi:protein phosphatase 2C domain-containing protein [Azospirillum sp. HJ39]|uniref:PP2C family protein-serine/threonine phosphatase n=1 Tax=Azospirillum sp. HJ39 TaxID=3159496 RepID=UPI0035574015